jgi:VWFA-related protein
MRLMFVLSLSLVLFAQEDPAAARKAFDEGTRALREKRSEDARHDFEKAVQLDPSHANAWFELGRLQVDAKDPKAARGSLEAATRADPKLFDAYIVLATLAQSARDWKGLTEVTERLLKLNAVDYPNAFILNAIGHYELGNKAEAEKCLRAAQEIDSEGRFPQGWQILGMILAERGDYAGAAGEWREFLKHAPPSPVTHDIEVSLADAEKRAAAMTGASAGLTFRAETDLALIRFQVSPKRGHFVTDLRAEDIEIREDGVPQKTSLFEGGRFYPRMVALEISLLFDASGSVQQAGNLNPHVFQQSLLDEYENASIAIYGFSDQLTCFTGPTRQPQVLKEAMDAVMTIRPGTTPLFGAIAETVRQSTARPGAIRLLIVFSDGESTARGDTGLVDQAIRAAQECGVAIYPVVLLRSAVGTSTFSAAVSGSGSRATGSPGTMRPPALANSESVEDFSRLAKETGGEGFVTPARNDVVGDILKSLSRHVQFDYVAGYYPASSGAKKRHDVEVVLKTKERGTILGGKRIVVH